MYESKYNNDLQEAFEAGYRRALNEVDMTPWYLENIPKGGRTYQTPWWDPGRGMKGGIGPTWTQKDKENIEKLWQALGL